jgi:hypothetical protein
MNNNVMLSRNNRIALKRNRRAVTWLLFICISLFCLLIKSYNDGSSIKADYDMLNSELIESMKSNSIKDKKVDSLLTLLNKKDITIDTPKRQIRPVVVKSKPDTTVSKVITDTLK